MKHLVLFILFISYSFSHVKGQNLLSFEENSLIDSLETVYFNRVKKYKDSLKINTLELKELKQKLDMGISNTLKSSSQEQIMFFRNNYDSIEFKFLNAALNMSVDLCLEHMGRMYPRFIDVRRVCLYLLDFSENPKIYSEIYYATYSMEVRKSSKDLSPSGIFREKSNALRLVGEDDRNLALWSLLKAFKGKDINVYIDLATYFEDGLHFPKNAMLGYKIKHLYHNRKY